MLVELHLAGTYQLRPQPLPRALHTRLGARQRQARKLGEGMLRHTADVAAFDRLAVFRGKLAQDLVGAEVKHGELTIVVSRPAIAKVLKTLRDDAAQNLDIIGPPLDVNAISSEAYILVRKGDMALREAVNAALNALWLEGTYHKISTRYFPFDIY